MAWAIVRTTLVQSFAPRIPVAAGVAGDSPEIVFALAEPRYAAPGNAIPDAVYRQLAAAFTVDPLADDPFLYFARQRIQAGDRDMAIRLLEEARRRNPRNRAVRILLVEQYVRSQNLDGVSAEIGVLSRLMPAAGGQLALAVARLMQDPAIRPAIVRTLAGDPLFDDVLVVLVRQGQDADLIMQLAQAQARLAPPRPGPNRWQPMLLERLVGARQYGRARELWAAFAGVQAPPERVYDEQFAGRPGGPPFNWAFRASELGSAELARGGGLEVDYFGRASGALARQLIMLRPGRYRLVFQADGSANGQGSRLAWRVSCDGAGSPLAEIPLTRVETARRAFAAAFEVPTANCDAQWLSLEGIAAEFPTTQSAHIAAVAITPLGPTS